MEPQSTLPRGWIELKTPDGRSYYQNNSTQVTQWERPLPPQAPPPYVDHQEDTAPTAESEQVPLKAQKLAEAVQGVQSGQAAPPKHNQQYIPVSTTEQVEGVAPPAAQQPPPRIVYVPMPATVPHAGMYPVYPPQPTRQQPQQADDPSCLYVLAVIGFFIPLVGWIGMCAYNCGNGLPPKQKQAFTVMTACTFAGFLLYLIINVASVAG